MTTMRTKSERSRETAWPTEKPLSGRGLQRCGRLLLFLALVPAVCAAPSQPAPRFAVAELATLGGASSEARAVNSSGQIVGEAETSQHTLHACLWQNGGVTDLGVPPGFADSHARALNDAGDVVGTATPGKADENGQAVLWRRGRCVALAAKGAPQSTATGINNLGVVVGFVCSDKSDGGVIMRMYAGGAGPLGAPDPALPPLVWACFWHGGVSTKLSKADVSQACAINNRGTVVGLRDSSGQPERAVVWIGGHETVLGVGQAMAVNNSGQVAGSRGPIQDKRSRYGTLHASLWTGGKEIDLGMLPGGSYSIALGVNDQAQVVGDAERTLPKGNRLPFSGRAATFTI